LRTNLAQGHTTLLMTRIFLPRSERGEAIFHSFPLSLTVRLFEPLVFRFFFWFLRPFALPTMDHFGTPYHRHGHGGYNGQLTGGQHTGERGHRRSSTWHDGDYSPAPPNSNIWQSAAPSGPPVPRQLNFQDGGTPYPSSGVNSVGAYTHFLPAPPGAIVVLSKESAYLQFANEKRVLEVLVKKEIPKVLKTMAKDGADVEDTFEALAKAEQLRATLTSVESTFTNALMDHTNTIEDCNKKIDASRKAIPLIKQVRDELPFEHAHASLAFLEFLKTATTNKNSSGHYAVLPSEYHSTEFIIIYIRHFVKDAISQWSLEQIRAQLSLDADILKSYVNEPKKLFGILKAFFECRLVALDACQTHLKNLKEAGVLAPSFDCCCIYANQKYNARTMLGLCQIYTGNPIDDAHLGCFMPSIEGGNDYNPWGHGSNAGTLASATAGTTDPQAADLSQVLGSLSLGNDAESMPPNPSNVSTGHVASVATDATSQVASVPTDGTPVVATQVSASEGQKKEVEESVEPTQPGVDFMTWFETDLQDQIQSKFWSQVNQQTLSPLEFSDKVKDDLIVHYTSVMEGGWSDVQKHWSNWKFIQVMVNFQQNEVQGRAFPPPAGFSFPPPAGGN
jgi:hypothetical protein